MGPVARRLVSSWQLRIISAALLLALLPGCPHESAFITRFFGS